jgi:hypothetical protein
MINYFIESWKKCKSQDSLEKVKQVQEVFTDEESIKVLNTRIQIFETGDNSLHKGIDPVYEHIWHPPHADRTKEFRA